MAFGDFGPRRITEEELIRSMQNQGTPLEPEELEALIEARKKNKGRGIAMNETQLKVAQMMAQDKMAREKATQDQMSLRMAGSPLPAGPGMPIIGQNVGAMLAFENNRRRAMAMTGEEMNQLLTKGATNVGGWDGNVGATSARDRRLTLGQEKDIKRKLLEDQQQKAEVDKQEAIRRGLYNKNRGPDMPAIDPNADTRDMQRMPGYGEDAGGYAEDTQSEIDRRTAELRNNRERMGLGDIGPASGQGWATNDQGGRYAVGAPEDEQARRDREYEENWRRNRRWIAGRPALNVPYRGNY